MNAHPHEYFILMNTRATFCNAIFTNPACMYEISRFDLVPSLDIGLKTDQQVCNHCLNISLVVMSIQAQNTNRHSGGEAALFKVTITADVPLSTYMSHHHSTEGSARGKHKMSR
jgi:hypothetical protein